MVKVVLVVQVVQVGQVVYSEGMTPLDSTRAQLCTDFHPAPPTYSKLGAICLIFCQGVDPNSSAWGYSQNLGE